MQLTFDQIRQFTAGAVQVTQADGILSFHRFFPEQVDAFGKERTDFTNGARCTTGIRVDFHTDSDFLQVHVACAGKYALLLDGLPALNVVCDKDQTFSFAMDGTMHRITLVLPSHSHGAIYGIRIRDGAKTLPHIYRKRFLFYGDSITQGWNSTWDCLSFPWQITSHYDADSYIFGVGGTFIQPDTLQYVPFRPDAIFVAYGTNDLWNHSSIEAFRDQYGIYIRTLQNLYPNTTIFCITPIWRADAHFAQVFTLEQVRQAIDTVAIELGCVCISGDTLVPPLAEFFAEEDPKFCLHPNDLGFCVYARNLIRAITPHM